MAAGVPYSNMLVGIPYYGKCAHITKYNGGVWKGGNISIRDIPDYVSDLKYAWDEVAHAPYYYKMELVGYDENNQPIYNKNLKISFDNERSITDKVNYVKGLKLKGVFVWHYNVDYDDQRLAKTIREAYK